MNIGSPIWITLCSAMWVGCMGDTADSSAGPAPQPEAQAQGSNDELPPCWAVPPERGAAAEWKHFAAVDRLDASLRGAIHGQLMHLCWAAGGQCPGDTVLMGFFRDILQHFSAEVMAEVPWETRGTATVRMGPVAVRDAGITVDAAAYIWSGSEELLFRRYALDAKTGQLAVLDDAGTLEDVAYGMNHAGLPHVDMEWAWPGKGVGQMAFQQRLLPALTKGVFAGNVSREIRLTPVDSAHWGWEAVTDFYGCGAPHGWVQHTGLLFDPRLPAPSDRTSPMPVNIRWDNPWAQEAVTRMRTMLDAYFKDHAEADCGTSEDVNWAQKADLQEDLFLCARPGPAGTVIPTLFNQGDPSGGLRSNGFCIPRLHLELSAPQYEAMTP
jgi:hypothetical protein